MNITWVVLLTLVAGVFAGVATNMISEKAKKHASVPVMGGLLGAAFCLSVIVQLNGDAHSDTSGGQTTSPTSTEMPLTPSPGISSPSPVVTSPPSPSTQPVTATSLLDLTWARESTESSIDIDFRGPISIDGTTHEEALVFDCNIWCNGTSPQVYEVTLGRRFKTFTATAAVLDEYNGAHSFQVRLDQREPQSFTTSPGDAVPINLNVEGVTRLRVEFHRTAAQEATIATHEGIYMGMALASPMVLP